MAWFVAVAVSIIAFCFRDQIGAEALTQWCSLLATVFATLLGFVVTALSILAAAPDKELIRNLKKSGHFDCLMKELFWTSVAMFIGLVITVICFLGPKNFQQDIFVLVAFIFSFAFYSFATSGCKFYLVMEFMNKESA